MFYIVLHHIFVMSVIPVFKGQLAHHWLSIIYCRLHFKCVWTIHMSHNEGMIYHPYYLWLEIIGINPIFPNTLARYNTMHQYMIRCKNGMNFGCTHFLHTSFNIFFSFFGFYMVRLRETCFFSLSWLLSIIKFSQCTPKSTVTKVKLMVLVDIWNQIQPSQKQPKQKNCFDQFMVSLRM